MKHEASACCKEWRGLLQASLLLRCCLIVWEAESAYILGRIFHSNVQPVLPVNPTCLEIFRFESCIIKPRAESHSLDLNKYVLY